jgi:mannose-1-phosphate guanylyltransferase / phosphomannomutase
MIKAVIMAGGFGTRLRPLTMNIPKPMVPLLNTPMMGHIVNLLKKHDIKDVLSVLYFNPEVITDFFEDGSNHGVKMKYVMAEADYGTAGAVRNAAEHLETRFIIISGDVLTDFDLTKAIEFHEKKGAKATLLLTRVEKPLQYGIVMTDNDGKITRFLEKPSWGQVFSDTINTGIYILEPEVLDLIPFREEFDFSNDLFPLMLEKNLPLYGYVADGYWRDIGNLDEYQQGQSDSLKDKVVLKKKGVEKDNIFIGEDVEIAPTAKFTGTVIFADKVKIGDHAELNNCAIGENSIVGRGAKLSGVTIWNNVEIGDFAELTDDVICNDCKIGSAAVISENVFIAENCVIGNEARLLSNIKLWPGKVIEAEATLARSLVQEEKWLKELFTDARISGESNIEIHPEFGAKLGSALGMTFGNNANLVASRDPDKVSRIMKRSITAGLSSVGVNVEDLQVISIPQTRQDLMTGKHHGGFHVRRSPRVPGKTDIIIFNKEGRDIQISVTKKIERFFFGEDIKHVVADEVGDITYPERANEIYSNRYLDSLDVEAIQKKKFKILMDYSYGLASSIFPHILGKLHTEALSLHDYVEASRFSPDPSVDRLVGDEAVKIMKSLGYELGFIMESGAEKIFLIDQRGVFFSPKRLLTLVTKLFLEANKDLEPYRIAVSIIAPQEIEEIAKDYDVEVLRIKSSHAEMMEATKMDNVRFVGGVWGNYIFSDFLFAADGMYSVGKVLEMIAKTELNVAELDEQLPRRYQNQVDVNCPWEKKGQVMRIAMQHSEDMERQLIEGVKIIIDDDSVLLLPDKERSAFHVIAESSKNENAVNLAKKYSALVSQWRDE